jgi:EAL domain-containing protein (putative c-di-GMP-specific phosphodiesterase class I)
MWREARLRAHVLEHLDRALAEGWVRPHYQGIVRSVTGNTCAEEALARWADPVFGPLMPAQFVPALEEAGLLGRLDMHIVDCVLADLAQCIRRGIAVVPVSVNLSLRDLASTDVAGELTRRADAAGVPHGLVRVEFTESTASQDPDRLKAQIRALHDAGFEVWMDDFGSGFSSLNALKEFDFDLIKLEMGFLTGGDADRRASIVEGVILTAKRLGIKTLAEGVETHEHAEELTAMGCDMLQGYHYFVPRPHQDVVSSIRDGACLAFEPLGETRYWDAVSSVSLADLARSSYARGAGASPVSELPACVAERRGGAWRMLRMTRPMAELLRDKGALDAADVSPGALRSAPFHADDVFVAATERCEASGAWERVGGPVEYGSGYQFSVKSLARYDDAEAYVVMSTPTSLGSTLGSYGDVPVGYAVFRVLTDE